MTNVVAKGNYFAMNSNNMKIDGLKLVGNYPFDGSKNLEIRNSRLMSKDAFWNAENITVYDSYISGDRKSTRLNSSHYQQSRMPSSA